MSEVAAGEGGLEDWQEDASYHGSSQCAPTLVAEDPAKHTTTVAERAAFGDNGSRHWIITTNTNAEQEAETEKPPPGH